MKKTTLIVDIYRTCSTPFGEFEYGEVIEAPFNITEWLIHHEPQITFVSRNWRWPGEKKAPIPIPTRVIP